MGKIMRLYLVLFLILIIGINDTFAGTIDPDTPDHKYVEFGKEFNSVGKICGTYQDGIEFCASCVVISPYTVLTAAHVVNNYKKVKVIINDKDYEISECLIYKEYKKLPDGDIAICYSKDQIKLDFYPPLYEKSDEVGKQCIISGYGSQGTFLSTSLDFDGKKRAGTNTIDKILVLSLTKDGKETSYESDLLICSPSRTKDKDKTPLEFSIASGDSGGGLFIDNKLAGIHSSILWKTKPKNDSKSRYESESGHTRISKYKKWILDNSK